MKLFRTPEYPKLPIPETLATKTGKGNFWRLADHVDQRGLLPGQRLAPRLVDPRRADRHHRGDHPVTGPSRTRLDCVRASLGFASSPSSRSKTT